MYVLHRTLKQNYFFDALPENQNKPGIYIQLLFPVQFLQWFFQILPRQYRALILKPPIIKSFQFV